MKILKRTKAEIKLLATEVLEGFYKKKIVYPIDVEGIMELGLKLQPYILPQLESEFSNLGEAYLSVGQKVIVIDESLYSKDSRKERLRFSLSHEIGHYILHRDIFKDINTKDITEKFECNKTTAAIQCKLTSLGAFPVIMNSLDKIIKSGR